MAWCADGGGGGGKAASGAFVTTFRGTEEGDFAIDTAVALLSYGIILVLSRLTGATSVAVHKLTRITATDSGCNAACTGCEHA